MEDELQTSQQTKYTGREFGGRTVVVDPLGDPGDAARDSYEKLLQFNARGFGKALQSSMN